ncbi:MAG: secondary thiamine-phosphate synthase enzyme YjbQ [Candidatus Eisenbacteria sp.]|nr:secondary thiamine-phosphate synthase enzyme YjbQ [Candidatus Eisenbacteria bacterium]
METLSVQTNDQSELIEITDEVRKIVAASGVASGLAHVYVPHTTAAVTINENADPTVVHDILGDLDRLVPRRQRYYQHAEGNSAGHVKSSLIGCCQTVLIEQGRLVLGTWQGIFFCEFDGPRTRRVHVTVAGVMS